MILLIVLLVVILVNNNRKFKKKQQEETVDTLFRQLVRSHDKAQDVGDVGGTYGADADRVD